MHDGDRVTQDGGHTPANRLRETCILDLYHTSLISFIHVMVNWHLSIQGICWPVSRDHTMGSSLELIEVTCFFFKLTADQVQVSFGLWAHVRRTCCYQGWVVWKPVNTLISSHPGGLTLRKYGGIVRDLLTFAWDGGFAPLLHFQGKMHGERPTELVTSPPSWK